MAVSTVSVRLSSPLLTHRVAVSDWAGGGESTSDSEVLVEAVSRQTETLNTSRLELELAAPTHQDPLEPTQSVARAGPRRNILENSSDRGYGLEGLGLRW